MKRRLQMTFLAALLTTMLVGTPSTGAADDEPLQVVTTFSILTDLVQQVGGEHVEVTSLVSSNVDAHTFDPSPEQVIRIADADLIVENGVEFEPWLDDIVESAQADALRTVAAEGVSLRSAEEVHEEEEADHQHGDYDPHIWQSVANAIVMVQNIRDGLIEADPDDADAYTENARVYITELESLDTWIIEQSGSIPEENRKLVTSHDTFGYFADRYGFEVIGSPLSISTEQAEPAAQDVAMLVDIIEESGVPAIFTENVGNPGLMQQIAESAGVELAPPLYTDALGAAGSPGETYIGMMRYNTETIVNALAP